MKKLNRLFVFGLSCMLIAGCSSGTTKDEGEKKIKIGYSVQTLSNPYFVTVSEGFKDYAKEKGIEAIITDGKQDAAAQVSQVENFISQKVDAIVITPVNDKALEDVVKRAIDAGIIVVASNQDFPGSQAFVTVPEYDYGYSIGEVAGKYIKENFSGECQVVVFDYPEMESTIVRGDGIRDGITKNAENANIIQSISVNTPEKGSAAMESILQKYPDVQAVVGVNDAGVLGAYEVVKAAGKDNAKFFMGGLDATEQALELIQADTMYRATVDIDPGGTGKLLIDTVMDVMQNGPKKDPVNINLVPVTKDNISEFLKK